MNEEVVIRAYRESDKPAVLDLLRRNTPRYFAPEEEADLRHYLAHEIEHYYVVSYNGAVVGCGGFNFSKDKSVGIISWDILHPDYQGKGLGSKLLNFRVARLRELAHIQTISVRTSQLVYRFYEKLGFKLLEVVKDYWAPGYDMYRMEYAAGSQTDADGGKV